MNEAVSPVEVNQGNVPATKGKVLYFEDDLELSNLFTIGYWPDQFEYKQD